MEERSQDGPEGLKSFPRRQNSPPPGPHFFNPPANRRYPECSCKNPGYATGSLFGEVGAIEVREHGLDKLCAGSRTESVERFSKSPL
jgi:hypothetical protein